MLSVMRASRAARARRNVPFLRSLKAKASTSSTRIPASSAVPARAPAPSALLPRNNRPRKIPASAGIFLLASPPASRGFPRPRRRCRHARRSTCRGDRAARRPAARSRAQIGRRRRPPPFPGRGSGAKNSFPIISDKIVMISLQIYCPAGFKERESN